MNVNKNWSRASYFFMCLLLFSSLAISASALVRVSPSLTTVNGCSGTIIIININISGVSNVYGYQFDLSYNSSVLTLINVTEGSFLKNSGVNPTYWLPPDLSTAGLINDVACTINSSSGKSPSGSGVLATIRFRVKTLASYPSTTSLTLSNIKISNVNSTPLNNSKQNGQVTVNICPACVDGANQTCTASNGCQGRQTCSGGQWGSCVATQYFCDTNCDGTNDTCRSSTCVICDCITGQIKSCTASNGCAGNQTCSGGAWRSCVTTQILCDTDCDGDNECSIAPCRVCQCIPGYQSYDCTMPYGCNGTRQCINGNYTPCVLRGYYCDNNCDGISETCSDSACRICSCVISDPPQQCGSTDAGECAYGTRTCTNGTWGQCVGDIGPVPELCDNKDNNCNNKTDEIFTNKGQSCSVGLGICTRTGTYVCTSTGLTTTCNVVAASPSVEVCDQGLLDEDCDGDKNENCNCTLGSIMRCGVSNISECRYGNQTCVAGQWGSCVGSINPTNETCDDKDNNCDGNVDEGFPDDNDDGIADCTADCGNLVKEFPEDCDGSDLGGKTCERLGYDSGDLGCYADCTYDLSDCYRKTTPSPSPGPSPGPSACTEDWICSVWGACDADGFRRRACVDNKNCGTYESKPNELETCLYEGTCNDGVMNGNEEGVDCGGRCTVSCSEQIISSPPQLNIIADSISAEILDKYKLKVEIENQGQEEVKNLNVIANKWSVGSSTIQSILPGMSEQEEFLLNLPANPFENSVEIQIIQNDVVVAIKSVPVTLTVPPFMVKINKDAESGRTYQTVILDNRDKESREVEVDVTINKGKETYFIDTQQAYSVEANDIFHKVDYLYQNFPPGEYDISSVLYEKGEKVGEATASVVLGGERRPLNVRYFFYLLLVAIVGFSGYMFFISGKKITEK